MKTSKKLTAVKVSDSDYTSANVAKSYLVTAEYNGKEYETLVKIGHTLWNERELFDLNLDLVERAGKGQITRQNHIP